MPDQPPEAQPPPVPPGSQGGDEEAWAALREAGSVDLESVVTPGRRAGERPALHQVTASHGQPTEVTVELRHRGRRATASEQALDSPRGLERAAARATVAALRQLLPPSVAELHLDWFDVLAPPTPSRPPVIHCTVALRSATGEDLLSGSSFLRDDPVGAAARAVLDAVNRRFSDLVGPPAP